MINEIITVLGYTITVLALGFAIGYPIGYLVGKIDNKK